MNELIKQVKKWSKDKGLDQADSKAQFTKSVEEIGEIASALCRNDTETLRDGIGDVIVTLIILAQQNNMTLYECLNTAYEEIKNRKGKMVNGTFVKSDDFR
ncbi:MazG-like family protein [Staphylococcus pettenkoferi]|uniref:MazG-like family protein n=1 Tax=Staphylococcus pettenkoferi TaxID=170573 RepID=UPI002273F86F|nr:MazG-like family protein [Staphylococcus pettenkoferi]MCY1566780.1 MazG-like family protein [Staphylococcus pettenkoferi]